MAGNGNLYASRGTREDEYYTDLVTIENELKHYREHFRDKVMNHSQVSRHIFL